MPIIPVYQPQEGIPTLHQQAPGVEAFPAYNESIQAGKLGAAALSVTGVAGHIAGERARRKQGLQDTNDVATAVMQIETEFDSNHTLISSDPEQHLAAPETMTKLNDEAVQKATEKLRPELQNHVRRQVFAQQLEYGRKARNIQTTAQVNNADVLVSRGLALGEENASRLNISDDEAMAPVRTMIGPGGEIIEGPLVKIIHSYVALGIWSEKKGNEVLEKGTQGIAHARATRLATDDPEGYKERMDREDKSQGSTFLRHLTPEHRVMFEKEAKAQIQHIKSAAIEQANQERLAIERATKTLHENTDEQATLMWSNPEKYGRLTMPVLEGMLARREITDTMFDKHRTRIQTQAEQGGVVDPLVTRRFRTEMYAPPVSYAATMRDLMANRSRLDPTFYGVAMNHLEEKSKAERAGGVPPERMEEFREADKLLKAGLRMSGGIGEKYSKTQEHEYEQGLKELSDRLHSGRPMMTWVSKAMPGIQSRTEGTNGKIAEMKSEALRKTLGLKARPIDKVERENDSRALDERTVKLADELKALPPTSPRRDQILSEQRALRDLRNLDAAWDVNVANEKIYKGDKDKNPTDGGTNKPLGQRK